MHIRKSEGFLITSTCTRFWSLLFCFLLVLPVFKQNDKKIPSLLLNVYKTIAQTGFIHPAQPWFSGSFLVLGKQPQQMFFITATVPGMRPGKKVVCPENSDSLVSLGAAVAQGTCREFPGNTQRMTWLAPELQRNLSALSQLCTPSLTLLCEHKDQKKQRGPLCWKSKSLSRDVPG